MWRGDLCESKTLRSKGQRLWSWVNMTGIWREVWSSCPLDHPLPHLKSGLHLTPLVCWLDVFQTVPQIASFIDIVGIWLLDVSLITPVSSGTAPHVGQEARRDSLFCPDELDSLFSYFDTSSKLRSRKFSTSTKHWCQDCSEWQWGELGHRLPYTQDKQLTVHTQH